MNDQMLRLRKLWFQIHKWIGILLAIILIPLSLTGSALVWPQAMDRLLNPARQVDAGPPALAPSRYVAAARAALTPDETITGITMPSKGAVTVTAAAPQRGAAVRQGPPARTTVWLSPVDAHVLDKASADSGAMRIIRSFHSSLMLSGRWLVGIFGFIMLVSSLTGIWLWWPLVGSVTRGFRWRRQRNFDANLHHLVGFWIAIPLAILSLTGALIAFPALLGGGGSGRGGPGPDRGAQMRARPLDHTAIDLDHAIAAASTRGQVIAASWPTDQQPAWQVTVAGGERGRQLMIDDQTGAVSEAQGQGQGQRRGGGVTRLMHQLHGGDDMGIVWQIIIFLGGIVPAVLGVTGIIMWLRTRTWRNSRAAASATAAR